jgi:hypothetical protein
MKLKLTTVALGLAFGLASAAQAQTPPAAKSDRNAKEAAEERIEQQYKSEREKCNSMQGNAKDICMAEAKGKQKVAKAELDAKDDKDPAKAQRKVAEARAEAAYEVAKEKCDDQKGEAKDACMKQARVERDRAKGKAEKTAEAQDKRSAASGGSAAPAKQK